MRSFILLHLPMFATLVSREVLAGSALFGQATVQLRPEDQLGFTADESPASGGDSVQARRG